jgi:hypothetical protein
MTLRVQPLALPILALMFLGTRGAAEDEAAVWKVFVLAGQSTQCRRRNGNLLHQDAGGGSGSV